MSIPVGSYGWSNVAGTKYTTVLCIDVWERMLGDEGDQQEEDCYHGDEDASRDPRSVETRSYAK